MRRALGYKLERTERFLAPVPGLPGRQGRRPDHRRARGGLGDTPRAWSALACDAARGGPRIRALPARSRSASRGARGGPAARQVWPCRPLPLHRRADPEPHGGHDEALRIPHKQETFQHAVRAVDYHRHADRRSDAVDRADFDADIGTLVVRRGKFGKSRELPLHPDHDPRAEQLSGSPGPTRPAGPTEALLISTVGTRLWMNDVQTAFRALRARAGLVPRSAACRPRLHDMRHSFAVRTLLDAYRTDGHPAPKIAGSSRWGGSGLRACRAQA